MSDRPGDPRNLTVINFGLMMIGCVVVFSILSAVLSGGREVEVAPVAENPRQAQEAAARDAASPFYDFVKDAVRRGQQFTLDDLGIEGGGWNLDIQGGDAFILDAAEVGTAPWHGRTLPAGIVRVGFLLINRTEGLRQWGCIVVAVIDDEEFSMWRELEEEPCTRPSLESDLEEWRKSHSFVVSAKTPRTVLEAPGAP